jgi:hypothetical protein
MRAGQPRVWPAVAVAALFAIAVTANAADAQSAAAERAASRFETYCVANFPDTDKITAAARRDGWHVLLAADPKRSYYSEIWQLDDKSGEHPALEIQLIHGMAFCATSSSVKEGIPIERLAVQHGWTEDAKTADVFNKDYPGTFTRLYRTRQDGRRVTIMMKADRVGTTINITHMRATESDPP